MPNPSSARVHEVSVVSNDVVARGIYRLVICAPELAEAISPGQFMSLTVPGDPSQVVRIPLSFSCALPSNGTVETEYAVVGEGTRRISQLASGDHVSVLGPAGHGWQLDPMPGHPLLVAGGIGITPVVAAARALTAGGARYDAIIGTRTAHTLWGYDELLSCGVEQVVVTSDDGTAGDRGLVTDVLEPALAAHEYDLVLACGPEAMMRACANICDAADVPCQVSMERMMTCGFGACGTCVVSTTHGNVQACMAGPVFEAKEVEW